MLVAVDVVPVASKNTDIGATPLVRFAFILIVRDDETTGAGGVTGGVTTGAGATGATTTGATTTGAGAAGAEADSESVVEADLASVRSFDVNAAHFPDPSIANAAD